MPRCDSGANPPRVCTSRRETRASARRSMCTLFPIHASRTSPRDTRPALRMRCRSVVTRSSFGTLVVERHRPPLKARPSETSKSATLYHQRSQVQVPSCSTKPNQEGGAADKTIPWSVFLCFGEIAIVKSLRPTHRNGFC